MTTTRQTNGPDPLAPLPPLPVLEGARTISEDDVTGVVTLVHHMLDTWVKLLNSNITSMEGSIIRELKANSDGAAERWRMHELNEQRNWADHGRDHEAIALAVGRFDSHLQAEEREEIAAAARIAPVKLSLAFLAHNWRNIALAVFVTLTVLGFGLDVAERLHQIIAGVR